MAAKRSPLSLPELVGGYLDRYLAEHKDHLPQGVLHECVVGQVERVLCEKVLELCEGNQSKTADLLGINRNTLSRKLKGPSVTCDIGKPKRKAKAKPALKASIKTKAKPAAKHKPKAQPKRKPPARSTGRKKAA